MAPEATKPKPAAAASAAGAAPAASGGSGGWLPIIIVLVAVPALSFAMAEFVLFPRLEKRLVAAGALSTAPGATQQSATAPASTGASAAEPAYAYEFRDIVSNLAGAMKSRYIKVTFTAYGSDPKFAEIIEANKAKLLDATLGVLGALNLAEMEDATIKNKVRTSLVQSYQTVLRGRVIEEVYFSEFVIQ
jgi:flagellar basal body-associated protein FliL